jgi:plasmid stability protein
MAIITIRNLDEKVKRELQVRAALNGRSMEAEARETLTQLLSNNETSSIQPLGTAIQKRFAPNEGVDMPIPPRQYPKRLVNEELKHGLGTAIHNLFAPLGGVDLQIPPRRKSHRQIPTFEE